MKKSKCDISRWNIFVYVFAILGVLHMFDITFWTRFGWQEPTIKGAIYYFGLAIISFVFIKLFCKKANIVKCNSCGEVFSQLDMKNEQCPNCEGNLIDVEKYYEKSNKS